MRCLLALIPAALLLPSCILGCGAAGENDQSFRRGTESLILCDNGGFAAMLNGGVIVEGRYSFDGTANIGITGGTTDTAFTLTVHQDGTADAPELGVVAWERISLDETDRTHAHVQCTDLESREWWTAAVPAAQ